MRGIRQEGISGPTSPVSDTKPFQPMDAVAENSDSESIEGSDNEDSLDGYETAVDEEEAAAVAGAAVDERSAVSTVFDFDESRGLHSSTHEALAKAEEAAESSIARGRIAADGADGVYEGMDRDAEYAAPNKHSQPHGKETFGPVGEDPVRSFDYYYLRGAESLPEDMLGISIEGSKRGEDLVAREFMDSTQIRDEIHAAVPPKEPTGKKVRFSDLAEEGKLKPTKAVTFPVTSTPNELSSVLRESEVAEARALFRAARQKGNLSITVDDGPPSVPLKSAMKRKPSGPGIA